MMKGDSDKTTTLSKEETVKEERAASTLQQNGTILWKIVLMDTNQEVIIDRDKVLFGRDRKEVDFVLEDAKVSRKHCIFILEKGNLVVEDLGSRNGTFVNGEKVQRKTLNSGDIVTLGDVRMKIVSMQVKSGDETISSMLNLSRTLEVRTLTGKGELKIDKEEKSESTAGKVYARHAEKGIGDKKEQKDTQGHPERRKLPTAYIIYGISLIISAGLILYSIISFRSIRYESVLQALRSMYSLAKFYYESYDFESAQEWVGKILDTVQKFSSAGDFSKVEGAVKEFKDRIEMEKKNREIIFRSFDAMNSGNLNEVLKILDSIGQGSIFSQTSMKMKEKVSSVLSRIFSQSLQELKEKISGLSFDNCNISCDFSDLYSQISVLDKNSSHAKAEQRSALEEIKNRLDEAKIKCEEKLKECDIAAQGLEMISRVRELMRQGRIAEAEKILSQIKGTQEANKLMSHINALRNFSSRFSAAFDKYDIRGMWSVLNKMKSYEVSNIGTSAYTKSLISKYADDIFSECKAQYERGRYKDSYILCSMIDKPAARQIVSNIDKRAAEFLKDCESAYSISNIKVALRKCEEVLKTLPEYSDIYKRARSLIEKLK